MRNAIITGITWPVNKLADVLAWVVRRLDDFTAWLRHHRKPGPKHRLTVERPGGSDDYGPDWLPATPLVTQDACPECGSDEWPLVVYDGLRMCPVCKDEAVITDQKFGHT